MSSKGVRDSALSFDEMMRARSNFLRSSEESLTSAFDLRTVLSEIGQYPPDNELQFCMDALGGKMSFNDFCNYLQFLKKRFMIPEPRDVDTLRAFVALGGTQDRRGQVNTDNLRTTIRHFDLTIDIDAMIKLADEDGSGFIDFSEFKHMWRETPIPGQGMKPVEDDEDPTASALLDDMDENNTQILKSFLFPKIVAAPNNTKTPGKRRTLQLAQVGRLPPIQAATSLMLQASAIPAAQDSDSDIDDDKYQPKVSTFGGYKPPSPVILSLRHLKPAKLKQIANFSPRKPGSPRGGRAGAQHSAKGGRSSPPRNTPRAPHANASTPRKA